MKIFLLYITTLFALARLLLANKTLIKILFEYLDYINIFLF